PTTPFSCASRRIASSRTTPSSPDTRLWRSRGGSSRIVARKNEITLGYVHTLAPDDPRHWFIWAVFKTISDKDTSCVELKNVGSDNEVAENHCYENFDGVENVGTC